MERHGGKEACACVIFVLKRKLTGEGGGVAGLVCEEF